MVEARRWYTSRPRQLPPREQAFIDAVLALARRSQRTRGVLLAAAFVVLGAFAVVATAGYIKVKAAQIQAQQALGGEVEQRHKAETALAAYEAEAKRRAEAEGHVLTAEEQRRQAEEQRQAEEKAKLEAQAGEMMSREQLVAKNAELEQSLADQKSARDRAEAASKKAEAAAFESQRLQKELQVKLDEEKARVKALQDEMKKISTKLKD